MQKVNWGKEICRLPVVFLISFALTCILTGNGPDHPGWILWLGGEIEGNGGMSIWILGMNTFFAMIFGVVLLKDRCVKGALHVTSVFVSLSMAFVTNHWLWIAAFVFAQLFFTWQVIKILTVSKSRRRASEETSET